MLETTLKSKDRVFCSFRDSKQWIISPPPKHSSTVHVYIEYSAEQPQLSALSLPWIAASQGREQQRTGGGDFYVCLRVDCKLEVGTLRVRKRRSSERMVRAQITEPLNIYSFLVKLMITAFICYVLL